MKGAVRFLFDSFCGSRGAIRIRIRIRLTNRGRSHSNRSTKFDFLVMAQNFAVLRGEIKSEFEASTCSPPTESVHMYRPPVNKPHRTRVTKERHNTMPRSKEDDAALKRKERSAATRSVKEGGAARKRVTRSVKALVAAQQRRTVQSAVFPTSDADKNFCPGILQG